MQVSDQVPKHEVMGVVCENAKQFRENLQEKLVVKNSSDTIEAHEEELRAVGIYLTSIKG